MSDILKRVVENLDAASSNFGMRSKLPITPTKSFTPLKPTEKWAKTANALTKKFHFFDKEKRNWFVDEILALEREKTIVTEPVLVIRRDSVTISLLTQVIEHATEPDQEFARQCDLIYKSVTI